MAVNITALADVWISRAAAPDPLARAAVTGLKPAVVVTGASAGIGRAIAMEFAATADALILVARHQEGLDTLAAEISAVSSARVVRLTLDVAAPGAEAIITRAAADAGLYVDVLVNNAGTGLSGAFTDHSEAAIDALVQLNVAVPTRLMRYFLPAMLHRARGGILNVASLGGWAPGPYQAAYYASKAFLVSLSIATAWENRGRGVRICVCNPGPVETGFHAAMGAEQSLYRWILPSNTPREVARAAVRGYKWGLRVVHPGLLPRAEAVVLRVMPHALLLPLMGWLLRPRRSDR